MNIDDLLNAAKTKLDLKSDYALAKRLDTSTSRIGHWRTGQRTPDEQACFQLAEILEESPAAIIAMVRLGKEKEPSKIEFWKRQATRYAIGAGIVALLSVGSASASASVGGLDHAFENHLFDIPKIMRICMSTVYR